ncbi:Hypothetical predicted protein [Paramuricea clavata]|uniref:Uncharacterized protein n=1 Tax=Paramuricea clavata TaxID=317549 RepID=A0A7D9IAV6_PARCT|nr:Hypothetical predicted protein [Paramuricea clavata]
MKTYFTVFVVVFAILNFVHDSQEFSAGAGTVTGRRTFDERLAYCEVMENKCQSLRQKLKQSQNNRLQRKWSNSRFEEDDKE